MSVSSFTLDSAHDALKISVLAVYPEGRPSAVLQIAHGMCGTKERMLPFMRFMAERGVACFANDHRGHGASIKSEGDLGYMYDGGKEALVSDMNILSMHIMEQYQDTPLYLLGHSMGSMAARSYIKQYPHCVDGLILCGSPAYNPLAPALHLVVSAACRCGMSRVRPRMMQTFASDRYNRKFSSEGPQAWICSDIRSREDFLGNPRHTFIFTFNATRVLMGLMLDSYSTRGWDSASSEFPVLFLSGEDDTCSGGYQGVDKAAAVMNEAGYKNISIKIYPAMRHEILNEVGKECVWQDILNFMGQ